MRALLLLGLVADGGPGPVVPMYFRRSDFQIVVAVVASMLTVRFGAEDSFGVRRCLSDFDQCCCCCHSHQNEKTDDFVGSVDDAIDVGRDLCHWSQTAQSHPTRGTRSEIEDSDTKVDVLLSPDRLSLHSMMPNYCLDSDYDHYC